MNAHSKHAYLLNNLKQSVDSHVKVKGFYDKRNPKFEKDSGVFKRASTPEGRKQVARNTSDQTYTSDKTSPSVHIIETSGGSGVDFKIHDLSVSSRNFNEILPGQPGHSRFMPLIFCFFISTMVGLSVAITIFISSLMNDKKLK